MKWFILLFVLIYIFGLLFLYVHLPEKTIEEEGKVFFYSCTKYDCAKLLLDLANSSQETKCAFYDLNEPRLVNYFEENDENLILYSPNNDYNLGTSVKINGLMHHKFCVFDDDLTLTGSWNPTIRGTEKNDNYVVVISSKIIAEKFLDEHDRLKNKEEYGSDGLKMKLSDMNVTVCFSPKNNCGDLISEEISKANKSIEMLAFSFTDKDIADSLVKAKNQGVRVDVLFEKTRISKYSMMHHLNNSNVSVFLDRNPYTMHEKLILIDNKTAIFGSYNPSSSAENKNDENLVIVTGLPDDFIKGVNKEISRIYSLV